MTATTLPASPSAVQDARSTASHHQAQDPTAVDALSAPRQGATLHGRPLAAGDRRLTHPVFSARRPSARTLATGRSGTGHGDTLTVSTPHSPNASTACTVTDQQQHAPARHLDEHEPKVSRR